MGQCHYEAKPVPGALGGNKLGTARGPASSFLKLEQCVVRLPRCGADVQAGRGKPWFAIFFMVSSGSNVSPPQVSLRPPAHSL